jgi:hypothetical protein
MAQDKPVNKVDKILRAAFTAVLILMLGAYGAIWHLTTESWAEKHAATETALKDLEDEVDKKADEDAIKEVMELKLEPINLKLENIDKLLSKIEKKLD